MADALTADAVTKRYGRQAPVLRDFSHRFAPGTLTVLTGPNGSGKTTLMRLLSVLATPSEGTIRYGTQVIHDAPHRYLRHVGIVHAEAVLPEQLTAVELLQWVMRSRGAWTDDTGAATVCRWLDRVALDERREQRIATYSSGMVKKTQIAAAFVAAPDVLLMDEPLRSLDAHARTATLDALTTFRDDGGLAIVASHLTDDLLARTDTHLELAAPTPSA
ncbi:ABC transporter ATP-binding protein [Longimonas halophila]|uniref:ABC transporter ATP-binding protein n=1 Tax=Longimonas halophila TaxID=1469170 RepID=A0A2H3NJW7_9BACT|nr:ABC transporter ATP-binding protein [Longimonas halophila]PEN06177.1 ABC transporter ATP-binding protein [Longimonas halophila]